MKNLTYLFLSLLISSLAWGVHPEVKRLNISGTEYTCRPTNSSIYCPRKNFDIAMSTMITIERLNCLESLNSAEATKEQIKVCFLGPRIQKFFNDLQIYDVKSSCLKENLKDCYSYDMTCGNPPCGDLGNFIQELKKRGISIFDKNDGEEACTTLIK